MPALHQSIRCRYSCRAASWTAFSASGCRLGWSRGNATSTAIGTACIHRRSLTSTVTPPGQPPAGRASRRWPKLPNRSVLGGRHRDVVAIRARGSGWVRREATRSSRRCPPPSQLAPRNAVLEGGEPALAHRVGEASEGALQLPDGRSAHTGLCLERHGRKREQLHRGPRRRG